MRILLIEDNPELRKIYLLTLDDYEVTSATTVAEAKFMLGQLFRLYLDRPSVAPKALTGNLAEFVALPIELRVEKVSDFIAGMTDRYASQRFREHFLPEAWGA